MANWTRNNVVRLFFLEIASIAPILIILGNVVPPFPLKLHHIGLGLLFLSALCLLMNDGYKRWLVYIAAGFAIVQLYQEVWFIKGLIDYFIGPFVLVVFLDLTVNDRLEKQVLLKYERRFYTLLCIPALIAIFQFLDWLPITFWNATYINYAYFGEIAIPRPNGFLYHGSELSIVIVFLVLFNFFRKENHALWAFLILLLVAGMTYFKALLGCVVLLVLYYLVFVNRGVLSRIKLIKAKDITAYLLVGLVIIGVAVAQFLNTVYFYTGRVFPGDILTGRGAIWNIYLERIKEFTWWNYLFGNGMGSSFSIFAEYATPQTWWRLAIDPNTDLDYDAHNAVLSVFINSGIVGIFFFVFLFRMIWNQVRKWLPHDRWNKRVFWGIILVPLFTIGVTITIYENAIFWICLGFLLIRWRHFTTQTND